MIKNIFFQIIKVLSGVGFEPTPSTEDQKSHTTLYPRARIILESGALDHSAILTTVPDYDYSYFCSSFIYILTTRTIKCMSEVGFEPTPSYEDQNTQLLFRSKESLSLAP